MQTNKHGTRREKLFGFGRCIPLDRNAKVRVMTLARALMRRTEKGKHYGIVTAKFVAVLRCLLYDFHNSQNGRCFPSYESISESADCARRTVAEALRALESAGILTWCHRLERIREACEDLFGNQGTRTRVVRTSNQYAFSDPKARECKIIPGTANQPKNLLRKLWTTTPPPLSERLRAMPAKPQGDGGLAAALGRLGAAVAAARG